MSLLSLLLTPLRYPWVLHYLAYGDSFVLVLFKHLSDKVLCIVGDTCDTVLTASRATRVLVFAHDFAALSLTAL